MVKAVGEANQISMKDDSKTVLLKSFELGVVVRTDAEAQKLIQQGHEYCIIAPKLTIERVRQSTKEEMENLSGLTLRFKGAVHGSTTHELKTGVNGYFLNTCYGASLAKWLIEGLNAQTQSS